MLNLFGGLVPGPPVAAGYRKAGWWRDTTFAEDLDRRAAQAPQRPALVTWRHTEGREQAVTFGTLAEQVASFTTGLDRLGVRPGQVVVHQLPDWWETAALALAVLRLGAVLAPLPMSTGAREVARATAATEAAVFMTVHQWRGRARDETLRAVERTRPTAQLVTLDTGAPSVARDLATVLGPAGQAPPPAPQPPDAVAMVAFTSGTTGAAKAVLHSGNTLYAAVRQMLRPFTGDERPQCVATSASLGHTLGLQFSVLGPLVHGHTTVVWDEFDAPTVLDLADRHRVRFLLLCPAHLRQLAECQARSRHHLPALRALACTATPLSRSDVDLARGVFPCPVLNAYGLTETAGVTCTGRDDPADWAAHSIGRPRPGVEVRSGPADDTEPPAGRAYVRGPAVCLATLDRDTARPTWTPRTTDGWYDTGDLVRPDGRGGLRYLGRVAERVSGRAALMIPVTDVERELRDHPLVQDAAVIGRPDERHGELPWAVVVPRDRPPTLAELHTHLKRSGMTDWYLPAHLLIVDELPRDTLGKVDKRLLHERLRTTGFPLDG
ncbi:AMP-binding protein [Streptomyces sp. NPDC057555]|uniref:AMP-binding protein n=1 Tax=Streptomyces sp. NPDC057555 TaxID=3346166 RepID=UPI00368CE480